MLEHVYNWPNITIGSNTDAIKYAYKNKNYLLSNDSPDVLPFNTVSDANYLALVDSDAPMSEEEYWAKLNYLHSMRGMSPFGNNIGNIRFETLNEIKVTTKDEKVYRLNFENARLFSLTNIVGLPAEFREELDHYVVYDWFDVNSGMIHEYDYVEDDDDFVNKINFFISTRIDGNKDKKDLAACSFMNEEMLNSPDYSDTIARLKITSMMNDREVKNMKMQLWKRDVFRINKPNYIRHENIVYMRNSSEIR